MPDTTTAIVGNLTDNPEVRSTEAGIARAMFRVAVSGPAGAGPSFFTVIVWRDQVEDVAESLVKGSRALVKGSRVGVVGRLQRSWTRKDGRAFYQTRLMCVCVCVSSGTPVPTQGTGGRRPLLPRSHPAESTLPWRDHEIQNRGALGPTHSLLLSSSRACLVAMLDRSERCVESVDFS